MPFLSRSINQIGKDADETSRHRDESLTASFSPQTSPKIPKTGTLSSGTTHLFLRKAWQTFV